MKRTYRLRSPDQFQRVRRDGRTWDTALLVLNAAPSRRKASRCGFVVTKRIGGAVERNRAKRRTREAVRLCYACVAPGWDLVFIIRSPAVAEAPFNTIQTDVERLLKRAGVWREPLPTP